MAELVGDAYVRIHADSTGMERAIQRQTEAAAERSGDSFLETFDRTIRDHADAKLRGINDAFTRAVATGDWDRAFAGARVSIDRFANEARANLLRINDALKEMNGTGMEDFNMRLDELTRWAESRGLEAVFDGFNSDLGNANEGMGDLNNETRDTDDALGRLRFRLRQLGDDVDEQSGLWRRWGNSMARTVILLRRDSDVIGRIFGAGSRSEILNFFGRTIGFFSTLPIIAIAGFSAIWNGITDLIDQFKAFRRAGFTAFGSVLKLIDQMLGMIGPGLIGLILSIAAISQVVPAFILLIGHLIGSLVALASAVAVGVVGGLTILLGMIPALVGGIGYLIIGFARLNDATDAQKKKLKPLTDAWATLQKRVGNQFIDTITKNVKGLTAVVKTSLEPLLLGIGKVVEGLLTKFTTLFNSKQMKPFLDALRVSIPRVLDSLGRAFIDFGAGFTAALKPLLPFVERVAKRIEEAAASWLKWASSPEGQTKLSQWFSDLYETAKKLWNTLGSIGAVIGTIISSATGFGKGGEGAGTDFLTGIQRAFDRLDEWLNEPVGTGPGGNKITRIDQFFKDVKQTVKDVIDFLKRMKTELDKIDWEEVKKNVHDFITAAAVAIGLALAIIVNVAAVITTLRTTYEEETKTIKENRWWEEIQTELDDFGDGLRRWGESLGTILRGAQDNLFAALVQPWIDGFNAIFGSGGLTEGWGDAIEEFFGVDLVEGLGDWGDNLYKALIQPFQDAWNGLFGEGGFFPNLERDLDKFWEELPGKISEWWSGVTEALTRPFRDWWNNLFGASIFPQVNADIGTWLGKIPGIVAAWWSGITEALTKPFRDWWNNLFGASVFPQVNKDIATWLGRIPGIILSALSGLVGWLTLPFILAWIGLTGILATWPGKVGALIGMIPGAIGKALFGVAAILAAPFVLAWSLIKGALQAINDLIKNWKFPTPTLPTFRLPSWLPGDQTASGGVFYGPTTRLIGEAGPEAVVPLNRDLALVDPAVRALSAFAQGKTGAGSGRSIIFQPGSIVVNSPAASPALVAEAVVDRIAARVLV